MNLKIAYVESLVWNKYKAMEMEVTGLLDGNIPVQLQARLICKKNIFDFILENGLAFKDCETVK